MRSACRRGYRSFRTSIRLKLSDTDSFSHVDSPEFATDIVSLFGTNLANKMHDFYIPSPAVLARLFRQDPQFLLAISLSGFYQAEGCVVKCRPSASAKYPLIDLISTSGAALYALMEFIRRCFEIETGLLTVTVPSEEEEDELFEEETKISIFTAPSDTEIEKGFKKGRIKLSPEAELAGVEMILEEERGRKSDAATMKALKKWQKVVEASAGRKVEDVKRSQESSESAMESDGDSKKWNSHLIRGLAHKFAERFAYSFPETFRGGVRCLMRKLDDIYRNGEGVSQQKVVFRLTYTANMTF